MSDLRTNLIDELQHLERAFDRASRGHYSAAEFARFSYYALGVPAAATAALGGVSALSDIPNGSLIAGLLALASAGLSATVTFLDPRDRATRHRDAAEDFNCLRYDARQLESLTALATPDDLVLLEHVRDLTRRRNELAKGTLQIPTWAYERAKRKRAKEDRQKAEEARRVIVDGATRPIEARPLRE